MLTEEQKMVWQINRERDNERGERENGLVPLPTLKLPAEKLCFSFDLCIYWIALVCVFLHGNGSCKIIP
jgi:hypothetical protein